MAAESLSVLLPIVAAGLEIVPEKGGGAGIRFRERRAEG